MKNQNHLFPSWSTKKALTSNSKKLIFTVASFLMLCTAIAQGGRFPVQTENLKRGAYKTFDEFLNNTPGIVDSFYIEFKIRNFKNWKGTASPTPRYQSNRKKVKKIWGFCDGNTIYIFHQKEFFPIEIHDNLLTFYGYGDRNANNINTGSAIVGGAADLASIHPYALVVAAPIILTGGIVAIASTPKYKKKKVEYSFYLRKSTGKSIANVFETGTTNLVQNSTLILYRGEKRELDKPFEFTVNDSTVYTLQPNEYLKLSFKGTEEYAKVCHGENYDDCFTLKLNHKYPRYFSCSIPVKDQISRVKEMKTTEGKPSSRQIESLQGMSNASKKTELIAAF